jgi:spermidine synthase
MPAPGLLLLFFGSGACALVYQVVWVRALTLSLSVTVYAVATVLCAFMAGLGLGSVLAGRVADRLARPLVAFGLAEIGIGVAGLLLPRLIFGLPPVEIWLTAHVGPSGLGFDASRFVLACALLLPACTLMGTTLPLLSRAVVASQAAVARGAGWLYAANTLGAVAGCLAAGFVLIPQLGLQTTSGGAALANFAIGAAAITLARRRPSLAAGPRGARAPAPGPAPAGAWLVALAFGVSGFTALGYEVLFTRALEPFTHNSTYAYTAMLATFLFGIGAGSAAFARWADHTRRPLLWLGAVESAIGVCVVGALLVYTRLLHWIPAAAEAAGGLGSWSRVVALIFAVSAVAMLPTAICFGATFPFVVRAAVDSLDVVGRRVALAYAVNTAGSIAGTLWVGFWLLPWLGLHGSFVTLVAINLSLGGALAVFAAPPGRAALAAAFTAAGLAAAFWLLPPQLFRDVYAARYGEILMYREQVTDTVMVTQGDEGRLIRYGDGRGTAGTSTYRENRSYAHLAMLPHPDARRVLQICFGVGNSLASVVRYPVERVDQVELSPGVIEAADYFAETNRNVLADPRVHLTIQDGRNFLLTSRDRYDVILLEPPELHTAGVVNLYTREFYEIARDHLAPGGLLSMWVNVFMTPEPEVRMVLRTLAEVFPHVTVWHEPWLASWIINGSLEPHPPDLALLERQFANPEVAGDLATIPLENPYQVLNLFVMADEQVHAWTEGAPILTDDHTRVDFSVPRSESSFFGVSNHITGYYLVRQMDLAIDFQALADRWCAPKQPVWTRLVNAGGAGARERLIDELGRLPLGGCVGTAQRDALESAGGGIRSGPAAIPPST